MHTRLKFTHFCAESNDTVYEIQDAYITFMHGLNA